MRVDDFIEMMTLQYETYVGITESDGPNHSKIIDEFNRFMGAKIGSPYCLSGLWFVLNDLSKHYGFEIDLPKTASTQAFFKRTNRRYIYPTPRAGDWGMYQSVTDPSKGHAVFVKRPLEIDKMRTIEFNTDSHLSRDGDGCYEKVSAIKARGHLRLLGFVRVSQALLTVDGKPMFV